VSAKQQSDKHQLILVGIGASAGGLAALRELLRHTPNGAIAYLVVHLSPDHKSYLADLLPSHSEMPVTQVTEAVHSVLMSAEVIDLTPRDRQVLERVAQGKNNKQIAEELGLASQTVRNYITNIYSKIGVSSRSEAVVWARERGLVAL
jgi:DNA-binding NarL/FixJ family response regulator